MTAKKLGIWMDHEHAYLTEFTIAPMKTELVSNEFTHRTREKTLKHGENLMHNKEQHQQSEYYKRLGEAIKGYAEVVLFGPTDAKLELFNTLKSEHRFSSILIQVKHADKMTENQNHAFVQKHFSRH